MKAARRGSGLASRWVGFALFVAALFAIWNLLEDFSFFRVTAYQVSRRDVESPLYNTLGYVGGYSLAVLGLAVACCQATRWLRITAYALMVVTVTVFLGFKASNQYGFTYHEASLLWSETDHIGNALREFFATYVMVLAVSLAVAVFFELFVRPRLPRLHWATLVLPLAVIAPIHRVIEKTYTKVYQFPIPYRVPHLTWYAWEHRTLYYGEREEPLLAPMSPPVADHIILVMDESVSGDLLGINGAAADTTPFLASGLPGLFNYGVASAISNLSSSSNILLQTGLRPDQIPDRELRSLKRPNVFSYMQRAGFRAFLLDAQIYSHKPPNFMTGFDIAKLDGHAFVRADNPGLTEYEIDYAAIDPLVRNVEENARSFTYLIKTGAHFPYDAKYPEGEAVFLPTLASGGEGGNIEKTLNSYRNALRWVVDGFLRELSARLEATGRRVLVVYTADHGQSLREAVDDDGVAKTHRPTRWPHATPVDPPPEQAMVPLLLLAYGPEVAARLAALYDPSLRDRVSQFELFPSLLRLAGYDPAEIRRHYSYSLFDADADRADRVFLSGNLFGIGGGFYQNWLIESAYYLNPFPDRAKPGPAR